MPTGCYPRPSLAARFWIRVQRQGEHWIWTGHATKDGYGQVMIAHGVARSAHRLAWELAVGPIPRGKSVLHRCDVKRCVDPAHLFLGTQLDNMQDMATKGRHRNSLKQRCRHGHLFTPENTHLAPQGRGWKRRCRTCDRKHLHVRRLRSRGVVGPSS